MMITVMAMINSYSLHDIEVIGILKNVMMIDYIDDDYYNGND